MGAEFVKDTSVIAFDYMPGHPKAQRAEYRCACGATFERLKHGQTVLGRTLSIPSMCDSCSERERARGESAEREAAELRRRALMARQTAETIPVAYRWATFDAPEFSKQRRFDSAHVAGFIDDATIVIMGPAGAGKTSLGCAILRAAAAKRAARGMWCTALDLSTARREQRMGTGEAELIRNAERASVLLVDDIGAERGNDTAVEEVVRNRYDWKRQTIYTCGFSRDEVCARYGAGIERRIFDGATIITLPERTR